MEAYNVQKFSLNGFKDIVFYGRQDELDYEKYVKFMLHIKEYLENKGYVNVSIKQFENGQTIPSEAQEVFWNGNQWTIVNDIVEQNPL